MKKIVLLFILLNGHFNVFAENINSNKILAAHNLLRDKVGSPNLTWSSALQKEAQNWANELKSKGCPLIHSTSNFGENLSWASPQKLATKKDANGEWIWTNSIQALSEKQIVVDGWGGEKQWFNYKTNECNAPAGKSCGHYTQIVWKNTTEVGCANAICSDASQVWVCNYSPAGNVIGQKPY